MKHLSLLFTCEHSSFGFPKEFEASTIRYRKLIESHRGWDRGAIEIARALKNRFKAPLIEGKYSRLLIDLNRSLNHSKCFSEITKPLSRDIKDSIIAKYYEPFRNLAKAEILSQLTTLHISIHSFTPILDGIKRNCDIGILYDPKRAAERNIALVLKDHFQLSIEKPRVRMNYPYKGSSNGHTTELRKIFSEERYLGIELEFNQAWLEKGPKASHIASMFASALKTKIKF